MSCCPVCFDFALPYSGAPSEYTCRNGHVFLLDIEREVTVYMLRSLRDEISYIACDSNLEPEIKSIYRVIGEKTITIKEGEKRGNE